MTLKPLSESSIKSRLYMRMYGDMLMGNILVYFHSIIMHPGIVAY